MLAQRRGWLVQLTKEVAGSDGSGGSEEGGRSEIMRRHPPHATPLFSLPLGTCALTHSARLGRDGLQSRSLLFVAFRNDDTAVGINDVMRTAAASPRIFEIEVHMPAVRFPDDPND